MWVRLSEILLAGWMAAAPWIFTGPERQAGAWADLVTAAAIALIAAIALRLTSSRLHLLNALLGVILIILPLFGPDPVPADGQNRIVVGFILAMLGVIPSRAVLPPAGWTSWFENPRESA